MSNTSQALAQSGAKDQEQQSTPRAPRWIMLLLIVSAIWIGMQIVCNVTQSLTGMNAAVQSETALPTQSGR